MLFSNSRNDFVVKFQKDTNQNVLCFVRKMGLLIILGIEKMQYFRNKDCETFNSYLAKQERSIFTMSY